MNELSKRAIDKINLFLNDKEFDYVSLSKRETKILFNVYQNSTYEIFTLEEENQQLKEQMINLYQKFKLNHVSTTTEYQMICMEQDVHKKEVTKLKEHIEHLDEQLQQKDEVIDEAIKLLKEKTRVIPFDKNGEGGGLELVNYDVQQLLEILQKYKGDNNE